MGTYVVLKTNKGKIEFDSDDKEEVAKILKDYGDAKIFSTEEIYDVTLWNSSYPECFELLTVKEVIEFLEKYYDYDEKLMIGALEYFKERGEDENTDILKKIIKLVEDENIAFITDTRYKDYEDIVKDLIDNGYLEPIDKIYFPFVDHQSLYDYLLENDNFVEYYNWLFYVED